MALTRRSRRSLKLRVPLSTSNVGPGFDAFSIAVNLLLEVRWTPGEATVVHRGGALAESVLSQGRDPVLRGMRRAAMIAGRELPPGEVQVHATLPPARGLGASGAGLAAGMLLANRLTGDRVDREELLEEAIGLEGHPENVTAAFLGGAHWSLREDGGDWIHLPVHLHRDLRFLLVVPPYPMSTQRAREVLPSSVAFARAAAQARRPPILLEGLRRLDERMIRAGVEDELHVAPRLRQLAGMASVAEAARKAGAIGVTLSGAGSALLVLTRTGRTAGLQERLGARVKRLWGSAGSVVPMRPVSKGGGFV